MNTNNNRKRKRHQKIKLQTTTELKQFFFFGLLFVWGDIKNRIERVSMAKKAKQNGEKWMGFDVMKYERSIYWVYGGFDLTIDDGISARSEANIGQSKSMSSKWAMKTWNENFFIRLIFPWFIDSRMNKPSEMKRRSIGKMEIAVKWWTTWKCFKGFKTVETFHFDWFGFSKWNKIHYPWFAWPRRKFLRG